jgi:hypothetical protein
MTVLLFALTACLLAVTAASAQIQAAGGGYYVAGYGTVYGSFGQASASQNLYKTTQEQARKAEVREAQVRKWGPAAVAKAERDAATGTSSNPKIVVPPAPVVRNYGRFRPDATVDTGKAMADALGDTPAEKALIKQIYSATKTAYDKQAAARGWSNNIAGSLTFFTVTAMTVYRDADEPSDEAANNYYRNINFALDDTPEFGALSNKDKQAFNNMLIGFSGILLAGYTEGKQSNDASTLDTYKKLSAMMIKMVLKTDPENLSIKNGQIVLK